MPRAERSPLLRGLCWIRYLRPPGGRWSQVASLAKPCRQALALRNLSVPFETVMLSECDPDCVELCRIMHDYIQDTLPEGVLRAHADPARGGA